MDVTATNTSHPAISLTSSKGFWEGHCARLGARPGSQGRGEWAWPSHCPQLGRPVVFRAYTLGSLRHVRPLFTPVKPHPADRTGASGMPEGGRSVLAGLTGGSGQVPPGLQAGGHSQRGRGAVRQQPGLF